jgi:hypothetical protein
LVYFLPGGQLTALLIRVHGNCPCQTREDYRANHLGFNGETHVEE